MKAKKMKAKFVPNDPRLCLYHANCTDGFGSAWAVWKRFGDTCQYLPVTHGDPPPDVTSLHVVIVDFSYPAPIIQAMARTARSVTILDHHRTAEAALAPLLDKGIIDGVFDMDYSGAVLSWMYYHDEPVPKLLLHVQDRDLWQWKLNHTREICASISSWQPEFQLWDVFRAKCDGDEVQDLIMEGAAIERKQQNDIRTLLDVCTRRMHIGGHQVPVANLPPVWASDAANLLAENEPFAACYYDRSDSRVFSLRSREDGLDVSAIAKQYGGGGHLHASGFKISLGWAGDYPETG
jgi:oligoribonuclease NrnB/cAMP/cGMP phosphodiesterase (DHH superfamily)